MNKMCLAIIATFVCWIGAADTVVKGRLPEDEVVAIKSFFKDFADALNSGDVGRISRMSGSAWKHFRGKLDCMEKAECFDIVRISTDRATNVITKATVIDAAGKPYAVDVVFDLKKTNGVYSIDKMRLPESERRHDEFEEANRNFGRLISALKNKDIDKVKDAVPFGAASDFNAELEARGLSWINDVINGGKTVFGVWGVRRSGREGFVGHVEMTCEPGGTNILREVIFEGLNIDRAAPRKETKEEFLKRFEAEKVAARKKYEERRASEDRLLEKQWKEWIRKNRETSK